MTEELKAWLAKHGMKSVDQAVGDPTAEMVIDPAHSHLFGFEYERASNTVVLWELGTERWKQKTRFDLDALREWIRSQPSKVTRYNYKAAVEGANGWSVLPLT